MVLLVASAAAGEPALRRTDGSRVTLASLAGRPAVLFYEDRHSHRLNAALKEALWQRGRARGLLDRAQVIAVANVAAYDFAPAREIATLFIRRLERQVGVPILLDLGGVLTRPPWSLPAEGASVVVLDATGAPVLVRSGGLDEEQGEEVLATIERLAGAPR